MYILSYFQTMITSCQDKIDQYPQKKKNSHMFCTCAVIWRKRTLYRENTQIHLFFNTILIWCIIQFDLQIQIFSFAKDQLHRRNAEYPSVLVVAHTKTLDCPLTVTYFPPHSQPFLHSDTSYETDWVTQCCFPQVLRYRLFLST